MRTVQILIYVKFVSFVSVQSAYMIEALFPAWILKRVQDDKVAGSGTTCSIFGGPEGGDLGAEIGREIFAAIAKHAEAPDLLGE